MSEDRPSDTPSVGSPDASADPKTPTPSVIAEKKNVRRTAAAAAVSGPPDGDVVETPQSKTPVQQRAVLEDLTPSQEPSWMDQLRTAPAPRVKRRKSAIAVKPAGPRREARAFDPTGALAGAMLRQVLNPALRARIKRREAVFVIVETPSAAWCEPMCEVAREMLAAVHTTRATVPRRAGAGAELSVVDEPLLAFTPERDFFHPSVVAAADVILCARITSSLVARAIEQCYGTRPPVSAETIAGLDFGAHARRAGRIWRGPC